MNVTTPARRQRRQGASAAVRAAVALVAVVTMIVVGLAGLFATTASAQTLRRPETRVGALTDVVGQMVGVHPDIHAGQGRARAPSYDQMAVGSCVAAETEGGSLSGSALALVPALSRALPTRSGWPRTLGRGG